MNVLVIGAAALTIVGGAVGEWGYYLLGIAVELGLLAAVFASARTWPTQAHSDAALVTAHA